jgi:hypothetical protein
MSFAIAGIAGDKELLDFPKIQRSGGSFANAEYIKKYGICKSRDPEWVIGGERHAFWLDAFDGRWEALIINPNQE